MIQNCLEQKIPWLKKIVDTLYHVPEFLASCVQFSQKQKILKINLDSLDKL